MSEASPTPSSAPARAQPKASAKPTNIQIKHGLTTEALSSYADLMRGETRQYFRDHVVTGKPFEVLEMMQELIILTASRTLQGKEVRENLDIRFAKLLEDLDKGFTPVNFLFPNLPLPAYKRRDKAQKEMSDFYMSIIEKRRSGEHDHENDMIAALQGSVYKNGVPLSDRDISHIMVSLDYAAEVVRLSLASAGWVQGAVEVEVEVTWRLWHIVAFPLHRPPTPPEHLFTTSARSFHSFLRADVPLDSTFDGWSAYQQCYELLVPPASRARPGASADVAGRAD